MVLNKIIAFFIVHEKISLTGERKIHTVCFSECNFDYPWQLNIIRALVTYESPFTQ